MPLAPLDATTGAAATARAWTARNALGSPGWTRKRWCAVKSYSWRAFWERERRNLAGHRAARCWAYNRERLIISALIYVRGTDCWSWKLALPSTDCISLWVILYWTGTLNCSLVLRCFNHEAMRQLSPKGFRRKIFPVPKPPYSAPKGLGTRSFLCLNHLTQPQRV